LRAWNHVLNQQ